jgi:hypothetical protein
MTLPRIGDNWPAPRIVIDDLLERCRFLQIFVLQTSQRRRATLGKSTFSTSSSVTMLNVAAQAGAKFATCSTDAYVFVKFCKAILSPN